MSEKDRVDAGVTEDLIRLSVGTEDIDDIITDLGQALRAIPEAVIQGITEAESIPQVGEIAKAKDIVKLQEGLDVEETPTVLKVEKFPEIREAPSEEIPKSEKSPEVTEIEAYSDSEKSVENNRTLHGHVNGVSISTIS